jgi:predicted acyl esterase
VTFAAGVRVVKNVLVPMRDGVHLAADLYLPGPEPPTQLPVVLQYIRYR